MKKGGGKSFFFKSMEGMDECASDYISDGFVSSKTANRWQINTVVWKLSVPATETNADQGPEEKNMMEPASQKFFFSLS